MQQSHFQRPANGFGYRTIQRLPAFGGIDGKYPLARFLQAPGRVGFDAFGQPQHLRAVGTEVTVGQRVTAQDQANRTGVLFEKYHRPRHPVRLRPIGQVRVFLPEIGNDVWLTNRRKRRCIAQPLHQRTQGNRATTGHDRRNDRIGGSVALLPEMTEQCI
ncbi:hypothetical protein [Spirosoma rhododendri]|uniref:hypothetical protein n=1 Tax=Spirosoma rhododendri TaxID=2728024 RepID=UPI002FCDC6DF